ncbi:unnamed protein product [Allacma fusca]|uniref:SSD domain-containing protein n=1 Tax=Allacma fusca TaxID=39272 RepID=A0A8J2M9T1_9HEXA|nr:unnamed protein product [Allacma fusca]
MRNRESFRRVPERVKQFYYKIGLSCSSYPYLILVISSAVVLLCCYPLLHMPLPGAKPQDFTTNFQSGISLDSDREEWPRWLQQKTSGPVIYIQQVIIKSSVNWNANQSNNEFRQAFRPVFQILDAVQTAGSLSKSCFLVKEIKSKLLKEKSMLPENKCLIVSPANFWQESQVKFESDENIVRTILNYQSYEQGRSGLAEILLGMNVRETGLKLHPFTRNSGSRTLTYAITIALNNQDNDFTTSLVSKLNEKNFSFKLSNKTSYIYYPPSKSYIEFIPLASTYIILFVYIYFSVKKIEIIHSKVGVSCSALLTIIASLCVSIGLCTYFSSVMNVNINSRIFPYLIGIVGLENVLVMTRSVVSTNVNLDVKIRFAQALSKDGLSITKNVLFEVTILTIGFFTFFPRIQEFCILAIVGILSDFFLQIFFYGTILSLDIRKSEQSSTTRYTQPLRTPVHPNLSATTLNSREIIAPAVSPYMVKIPKRLRLVYFWAKTRFFQRTFMIIMIGWISIIMYEVISHNFLMMESEVDIVLPRSTFLRNISVSSSGVSSSGSGSILNNITSFGSSLSNPNNFEFFDHSNNVVKRSNCWQTLVSIYNVSVTDKYLQILPSITVYINSRTLFNVNNKFDWDFISKGRQKPKSNIEFFDDENQNSVTKKSIYPFEDPYIPSSPIEVMLTLLLAIPSLVFICYGLVVFYRCVCSRNYAEWRSSWNSNDKDEDSYTQVIFEAVPLVMTGHIQEVECIGSDGNTIASVCLNGVLKIWNTNAENIASVDRKRYFEGTDNEESDSNDEPQRSKHTDEYVRSKAKMSKQPVWCLDIDNRIIALGTGTGRLEIWDSFTGALKATFDQGIRSGITCTKIIGARIVIARLNGSLDFIQLDSVDEANDGLSNHNQKSNPYHRWSAPEDMAQSNHANSGLLSGNEFRCNWLTTLRAHQQPITCLDADGGQIVSGSQDHTLKVFRLQDTSHLYTLHGHYGPITSLFIDKYSPMAAGSGSQDGMLCVWDLQTGACMYSIQAHDGPTTGLTYSASYIISVGGDDKICVWERFQGHLLNTIQLDHAYSSSLVMLTHNLLITSKQGSLIVWDVQSGNPVRSVRLGHRDNTIFVRQIINCGGAVLCDYGAQLRLVRFPSIVNKFE